MTTIPRVRDLSDLITVVPLLAGFTPRDAVVIVCPTPAGRVALQRIVLPPPDAWSDAFLDAAAMVETVLPALQRSGLRRATVIGYLSDPMDQGYVGALVNEAGNHLHECGLDVMGVALVCEDMWWRPGCPCGEESCTEPQPVPRLHESAAATALVAAGAMVHDSPEALLAPWAVGDSDEFSADDLVAATRRWRGRKGTRRLRREALDQWVRVVAQDGVVPTLTVDEVAALLWSVREVQLRDALIAWLTPGDMPLDVLDHEVWSDLVTALGPSGSVPRGSADRWTSWPLTVNLQGLLAVVPLTHGAPLACLSGLWAWWNGDGVVSRFLLERALDAEPGHTLAGLILRLVHHGIPLDGSPHGLVAEESPGACGTLGPLG